MEIVHHEGVYGYLKMKWMKESPMVVDAFEVFLSFVVVHS